MRRRRAGWAAGAAAVLVLAGAVRVQAQFPLYRRDCPASGTLCSGGEPAWQVLPGTWRNPFEAKEAGTAPGPPLLQARMEPPLSAKMQAAPQAQAGARPAAKQEKKKVYSSSPQAGSPGHIFWVVPAFKVNYAGKFKPLTPKEKFQEWAESAYDPEGLALGTVQAATLQYSASDGFCGYGSSLTSYLQCFGSMQLDSDDSSFWGDYVFTVWWHQDPRYFRLGKGGFAKRTLYAISRVFVTFNDSGKNVFYSSALAGTTLAAVVSNFYYPQQDRGVGPTIDRVGIDLGDTAIYNGSAEFWPDIHRWLRRKF
ncbi:MAG: hypothetical protein ACLGPM_06565 [Acidobacteriota bacterium]